MVRGTRGSALMRDSPDVGNPYSSVGDGVGQGNDGLSIIFMSRDAHGVESATVYCMRVHALYISSPPGSISIGSTTVTVGMYA